MAMLEANHVVGLRIMKLIRGGRGARREAELMISEKIDAVAKPHGRSFGRCNSSPVPKAGGVEREAAEQGSNTTPTKIARADRLSTTQEPDGQHV